MAYLVTGISAKHGLYYVFYGLMKKASFLGPQATVDPRHVNKAQLVLRNEKRSFDAELWSCIIFCFILFCFTKYRSIFPASSVLVFILD